MKSLTRTSMVCALLIISVTAVPTTAQQNPAGAVPDNIAPHPAPAQPLPFSHRMHLASELQCQICHVNPDPGDRMTFPANETCMSCHRTIATDAPAVMTLTDFSIVDIEIPWVRVYAITPGVTWSHRAHLDAGTRCETCHGDVGQLDAMAETKAIRAMATCIGCHQARGASVECVSCHAWPSDQDLGIE